MADLSNTTSTARFHNMPASMLADALGALDAQIKALESEKILLLTRTTPYDEVTKKTDGMTLFYTDLDKSKIDHVILVGGSTRMPSRRPIRSKKPERNGFTNRVRSYSMKNGSTC